MHTRTKPFQRPATMPAVGLSVALGIYAVASAPAPSSPGLPEALIAVALMLGVGLVRPLWLGTFYLLRAPDLRPLEASACLTLLLAVWPGLLTGLAHGWSYADIARDLLPFAFLFLPVLVRCPTYADTSRTVDTVAWGLAGVGLVYAIRWWGDLDVSLRTIGAIALVEKPPFLLKSAALPFASVWLFVQGLRRIGPVQRLPNIAVGLLLIMASLTCLGALAGAVHRAGLLLASTAVLIALARRFGRSAGGWLFSAVVLSVLYLCWGEAVSISTSLVLEKTRAVGVNNRLSEFLAVMEQATATPLSFLFGHGWGGLIRSPATGNMPVSYTHNIFSYALLKTGVLGLAGMTAYLGAILARMPSVWRARPELVLALVPPVVNGLLLHTSYKYLCFGIVLLLLVMASSLSNKRAD